ncbi:MAG: hypothetical protein LBQ54_06380 [Planctomycetaceae bacterium]|jgi:hypothetical protein|nr:hypothetical protein [Planctomycetaceae bacterium]
MSTRREFLKQVGILGTTALVSQAAYKTGFTREEQTIPDVEKVFTVPMEKAVHLVPPKQVITIPDVDGFKVLKGDFHMHTIFSDGRVWPGERVVDAVGNGLDVISITDHIEYRPHIGGKGLQLKDRNDDYNIWYDYAKETAEKQKLILVHGAEITKSKLPPGHFNALFIKDVNPIAGVQNDINKMFEETVKQGGFLQWNHPGWGGQLPKGTPLTFFPQHEEFFRNGFLHGIETFNGKEFYPSVCQWCESKDLAVIANSDIHGSEFETYGVRNSLRPMTLILAKERTYDSIKEAFFAKRTIASAAGMIIGREKWVKPLFKACVEIRKEGGKGRLVNKSSLPMTIAYAEQTVKLGPLGTSELQLTAAESKLCVVNWCTIGSKSLVVDIEV